jgi:hypothetical protein
VWGAAGKKVLERVPITVQLSGRRRGSAGRFRIRFYIKYTSFFLKKQLF